MNNNGQLLSNAASGGAVRFGSGDDTFNWFENSFVGGSVRMRAGYDTLNVLGANVFGETEFYNVETVNGSSFTISEDSWIFDYDALPGASDGILYTANSDALAAGALTATRLVNEVTRELLNRGSAVNSGGLAQASASWWVLGNANFQEDRGQGNEQNTYNVAVGRDFGKYELFFGLQKTDADTSASTDTMKQDLLYIGATVGYDLTENTKLSALGVLGVTNTKYGSGMGSASTDGTFVGASVRIDRIFDGKYQVGGYLGASQHSSDGFSMSSLSFSSQDSSSFFAGVDFQGEMAQTANGGSIRPIDGLGLINGSSDAVTLTGGGGGSSTVAGSDDDQRFFHFCASYEVNGWWTSA